MSRSISSTSRLVCGILAVVLLAVVPQTAKAVELPWFNVGSGFIPNGFSVLPEVQKEYGAAGFSVPVGRYASRGNSVETIAFDTETLSGEFKGDYNFQSRFLGRLLTTFGDTDNGAVNPGTFSAIDQGDGTVRVFFFAEFNPIVGQSTGLFRNVTGGSLMMPAISTPFDPNDIVDGVTPPIGFTWIGFGHLEFGGSDD